MLFLPRKILMLLPIQAAVYNVIFNASKVLSCIDFVLCPRNECLDLAKGMKSACNKKTRYNLILVVNKNVFLLSVRAVVQERGYIIDHSTMPPCEYVVKKG